MTLTDSGFRRPLTGHSGAELFLIERSTDTRVRKQAKSLDMNSRLRAQAAKLASANAHRIPSPLLIDDGEDEGLYWFEMEYIAGQTVAHALIAGREIDWHQAISQIIDLLDTFRLNSANEFASEVFCQKIRDTVHRCAKNDVLRDFSDLIQTMAEFLITRDWSKVPLGEGHGDLTLENIIIRHDEKLVFIDFDVPDQDSYVLDIGKLYQDLHGQWFLRRLALDFPESVHLFNVRLRLARAIRHFDLSLMAMLPRRRELTLQLAAFHLMRTLPYARDIEVPRFVLGRIAALMSEIMSI